MAAPTIRGSTAPASGASSTSHVNTAVGDLVVVVTWSVGSNQTTLTHTLQAGFTEIRQHAHDDGTTDGRLSVAYKVAAQSGASAYTPYTIANATASWTGSIVITTGDYLVLAVAGWNMASATNTVTAPTNYTLAWDIAGAAAGEVALATRALTSLSAGVRLRSLAASVAAPTPSPAVTHARTRCTRERRGSTGPGGLGGSDGER